MGLGKLCAQVEAHQQQPGNSVCLLYTSVMWGRGGGRLINLGRQSLYESSPGLQSSRKKELRLIISAYAGFS